MLPRHLLLIESQSLVQNAKKNMLMGTRASKTAKNHKQLILPINTSPNVNVLLNNITFL